MSDPLLALVHPDDMAAMPPDTAMVPGPDGGMIPKIGIAPAGTRKLDAEPPPDEPAPKPAPQTQQKSDPLLSLVHQDDVEQLSPEARKNMPVGSQQNPEDNPDNALPPGAIARGSLAPDPQVQMQRYAEYTGRPVTDFYNPKGTDRVLMKVPGTDRWTNAVPEKIFGQEGVGNKLEAAGKWAASGVGQAIPMATGAVGAIAGAATPIPGMAMAGGAGGGALGELARQSLDHALTKGDEATPYDWANVGWQALQQGMGPLAGKAIRGATKGIDWAAGKGENLLNKWTGFSNAMDTGAQKFGDAISSIPPLQTLISQNVPIVAKISDSVNDAGQNLIGLTERARDAILRHLKDTPGNIAAKINQIKNEWGIELDLGQGSKDRTIQQMIRDLGRDPAASAEVFAKRRAQDEQVGDATGKLMDEISPWRPDDAGDAVDAFRQGAVESRQLASQELNKKARQAFGSALDDRDAAGDRFWSPDLDDLFKRPSMQKGLAYAREIAAERGIDNLNIPTYENGVRVSSDLVPTWRGYESIRKAISSMLRNDETLVNPTTGILNEKGAAVKETYDKMMGILLKKNPEWGAALTKYGTDAHDMNLVLRGGLRKLVDMDQPDRLNMITSLFKGGQGSPMPSDVAEMRQYFVNAGKLPEWNAGIRAYIQDNLSKAIKGTQAADASNVGGRLHMSMFSPNQRAVMVAALDDPELIARWDSFGDAMSHVKQVMAEGSPTGTVGVRSGMAGMLRKTLSALRVAANPVHGTIHEAADLLDVGMTPEMIDTAMDYMLTTDGDRQVQALQSAMKSLPPTSSVTGAKTPPKQLSPKAVAALNSFLAGAAAHGASKATQRDPQKKGYADGGDVDPQKLKSRKMPEFKAAPPLPDWDSGGDHSSLQ